MLPASLPPGWSREAAARGPLWTGCSQEEAAATDTPRMEMEARGPPRRREATAPARVRRRRGARSVWRLFPYLYSYYSNYIVMCSVWLDHDSRHICVPYRLSCVGDNCFVSWCDKNWDRLHYGAAGFWIVLCILVMCSDNCFLLLKWTWSEIYLAHIVGLLNVWN